MKEGTQDSLDEGMKRNSNGGAAATIACPIATTGEIFADGSMIELIGRIHGGNPALMLWDGAKETVGARVEHDGQIYEPARIDGSVLQELILPTRGCPHGSTREFLAEICALVANFAGLEEKSAALVGRFVLASSIVEAVSLAPALVIVGPDSARGNRLVTLLRSLYRHSLELTGVTPAGFSSLACGPRFTFIISQSSVSDKLRKLLDDASCRNRRIPFRGGLLDLFGLQVIHIDSNLAGDFSPLRSIQISMTPTGQELPGFDPDVQHRLTDEFQGKLLSFRRANLRTACKLRFDSSKFIFPMRELAHSVAAATPDDAELQAEVFDLLRDEVEEIRSGWWVESSAVAVETLLVACKESPGGVIYVGELAEIAQEILARRGEETQISPGAFGKRLKLLGFTTEPRDAKGIKVRLTQEVCHRAHQLAHHLGVPQVEDDAPSELAGKGDD